MTETEAKRLFSKAKRLTQRRFPGWWEDIAQEVMLNYLSGKGEKQSVGQAVSDTVRKLFGDPRNAVTAKRKRLSNSVGHLVDKLPGWDDQELAAINMDTWHRAMQALKPIEKEIAKLVLVDGLELKEIAARLGVGQSRVSQRIKEIECKLISQSSP